MTEQEFKDEIKSDILIETPFAEVELTDPIMDRAIEKAFSRLNMYRPRVIKTSDLMEVPGYKLLRAYTSKYDETSHIPFIEEYGMSVGTKYLYSTTWTIETISQDRVAFKYFKDLVTAFCGVFMANVRRSANISGMPFELNGEAFYTEFNEKVSSVTDELINTSNNTY